MMGNERRRGTALLAVLVFVMLLAGLGASLLQADLQISKSRQSVMGDQRAFYAAESIVHEAWLGLSLGTVDPDENTPVMLGSAANPRMIGSAEAWAEVRKLDARRFQVDAFARADRSERAHEVIISFAPDGLFQYAAFGASSVQLDSNAFVDSYDSLLGDYTSQVPGGQDWADDDAVVGSNGDITLRSNTRIYGDCHPGPGGTLNATAPGILVTGSTDPANEPVVMPHIDPPPAISQGSRNITADVVIGPGTVRFDDVSVSNGATVTVVGPCDLVMDNFEMLAGTELLFEPANGTIDVHSANDFVLNSNTSITTNSTSAVDVQLFLNGVTGSGNTGAQIELSANSAFVGAIYAPYATVSLGSNFEVFGSVMVDTLDLSSNGIIHFDEALLYDTEDGIRNMVTLAWRRRAVEN